MYSSEVEAVLTQETGLDGNGRLLDVGCGPGMLTGPSRSSVRAGAGLDSDTGMLAESCRAAEEEVMNIRVGPGPG